MYEIQGQQVTMPVEIRSARVASAMFAVSAATAQEIIDYSGLRIARFAGRAVCSLAFVDYRDGDLGPYHEFAVAFGVRGEHGIGAFIHWLPVDGGFTLEAGRSIWGFPKELGHIPIDWDGPVQRCAVRLDGRLVVSIAVRPGLAVPEGTASPVIDAYSCLDGVTRRTPWTMSPGGVRMRPGGGVVRLGDHPRADELRRLGLHRARALSTSTVERLQMSFGEAEIV